MNRALIALAVVLAILAVVLVALIQIAPGDPALESSNLSLGRVYLNNPGGGQSQIYLVSSNASFGRFGSDVIDEWEWNGAGRGKKVAVKGDPFVIISGTIRNDESQGVWVGLMADLYDTKGEKTGEIVRTNGRPEFKASYLHVPGHGTGDFSIRLTYDRNLSVADISGYDIRMAWIPTATAPP